MSLLDYALYQLARRWPSPMRPLTERLGASPGTAAYARAYARDQFNRKVRDGLGVEVWGKDVLEIGCGHGGITCFIAASGARHAVGIDLDAGHLEFARGFRIEVEGHARGGRLPVSFVQMSASAMGFGPAAFDLVIADNLLEHVRDPQTVLGEAHRVLRPGGMLSVPIFSSILSKYGLHLKHGLKLPWANLLFSERTIVRAMKRLAADDQSVAVVYPGINGHPASVADLRTHKDLNDMTYERFHQLVRRTGFLVERFQPIPNLPGQVVRRIPGVRRTALMDVMSYGATALLKKRDGRR